MVITNLTAAPQFQSTVRCHERRQPLQSEVTIVVFDVAHRCTCRIYYEGRLALIKGYKPIKRDPSNTLSELNSSNYGRVAVVHILDAPGYIVNEPRNRVTSGFMATITFLARRICRRRDE